MRGGDGVPAQKGRWSSAELTDPLVEAHSEARWALRRLFYGIDSVASEPWWQVFFLLVLAIAITTAGGRVMEATDNSMHSNESHDTSYSEGVWLAWTLFVDPASIPYAEGLATRVVASIIVIVGIGYFAIFLALVVDGVQEKLDSLKHGRSAVVERGHTVVLGWTEEAPTIIRELCLANESQGGGCIAVLCERSKRAMEAELAAMVKPSELRGTRVVFRSGSRLRSADLRKVSTETARSVIVTSNAKLEAHVADAEVLQVVLNLSTLSGRYANVVAEVRMSDNEALLHLISQGTVAAVSSHDLCGALMLEFARQPGLNSVYRQVLGFEGAEFYVRRWPELDGRDFGELAALFPDAVPVGIIAATGECEINPPRDRMLCTGDELVVLAEDDDSYAPRLAAPAPRRSAVPPDAPCFVPASSAARPGPECVLLAGWRRDVPTMLLLLDRQVAPGSELHILSTLPVDKRLRQIAEAGVDIAALSRLTLVHHVGNSAVRRYLEELPLERFTSMIIAADASLEVNVIRSDSQCLATLLLVRGIHAARRRRAGSTSYATFAALRAAEIFESGGGLKGPIPPLEGEDSFIRGGSLHGGTRRIQPHHGTAFGLASDVIHSASELPIVVEILDPRTQRTVSDSLTTGLDQLSDFMNSNDLVSKILAMTSEDAKVKGILDQLLGGYGTQFAVVPSEQVVQPEAQVSYDELAAHCSVARRSVLCGYITPTKRRGPPECVLNPGDKSAPRAWGGCGLVLIVADAERIPGAVHSSPSTPAFATRRMSARLSAADNDTPASTLSRTESLRQIAGADEVNGRESEYFEFAERSPDDE